MVLLSVVLGISDFKLVKSNNTKYNSVFILNQYMSIPYYDFFDLLLEQSPFYENIKIEHKERFNSWVSLNLKSFDTINSIKLISPNQKMIKYFSKKVMNILKVSVIILLKHYVLLILDMSFGLVSLKEILLIIH